MNTLTKHLWFIATFVTLLLNVMLLCKSTLNLTTIIYTRSPEILLNNQKQAENTGYLEEKEKHQGVVEKAIDLKNKTKQVNWSFERHVGQPLSQNTFINTLKTKVSMIVSNKFAIFKNVKTAKILLIAEIFRFLALSITFTYVIKFY